MAVLAALRRNLVLFVPVLAWTLLRIPQLVLDDVSPLLAGVLSRQVGVLFFFVTPFLHAGLVGMADEALDGRTSLGTFLRTGADNYVSVLACYLLLTAVNFGLGFGVLVGGILGGLFLLGGGQVGSLMLGFAGLFVALLLVALVVLFFVQFYGHAIVIDGTRAVEGMKRSASLVRRNLARTLAYSVVGGVVAVIVGFGLVVSYFLLAFPTASGLPLSDLPTVAVVAGLVAVGLVQSLVGGAFTTYSVAFYRGLTDGD